MRLGQPLVGEPHASNFVQAAGGESSAHAIMGSFYFSGGGGGVGSEKERIILIN